MEDPSTIRRAVADMGRAPYGGDSLAGQTGDVTHEPVSADGTMYPICSRFAICSFCWEVATHARQIDPKFPVLYITGAYAHQWALRGVPNSALLTKPFAPPQLVTAVSQLLDTGRLPTAPAL